MTESAHITMLRIKKTIYESDLKEVTAKIDSINQGLQPLYRHQTDLQDKVRVIDAELAKAGFTEQAPEKEVLKFWMERDYANAILSNFPVGLSRLGAIGKLNLSEFLAKLPGEWDWKLSPEPELDEGRCEVCKSYTGPLVAMLAIRKE